MTTGSRDPTTRDLTTGDVAWASLGLGRGREQIGHRPVVIIATNDYLDSVDTLAIVVPVTSRDRAWPHHVPLTGPTLLDRQCWAMTEQITTITRNRITHVAGRIDDECLSAIREYLRDFLEI